MLPLNEKLKIMREENGLSQEELAIKLNVVRQTVSKWEKCLSVPDAEMLMQIATVYDTTVGALMGEEQVKPSEEHLEQEPVSEPTSKRRLGALSIVLFVVGSVVWVPLLFAVAAVVLAFYIVIWACIVSLWAAFAALGALAVAGVAAGVAFIISGNGQQGFALVGAGLFCAGLAIFAFFGCKALTKGVVWLTKKSVWWLKNRCAKKEAAK